MRCWDKSRWVRGVVMINGRMMGYGAVGTGICVTGLKSLKPRPSIPQMDVVQMGVRD